MNGLPYQEVEKWSNPMFLLSSLQLNR